MSLSASSVPVAAATPIAVPISGDPRYMNTTLESGQVVCATTEDVFTRESPVTDLTVACCGDMGPGTRNGTDPAVADGRWYLDNSTHPLAPAVFTEKPRPKDEYLVCVVPTAERDAYAKCLETHAAKPDTLSYMCVDSAGQGTGKTNGADTAVSPGGSGASATGTGNEAASGTNTATGNGTQSTTPAGGGSAAARRYRPAKIVAATALAALALAVVV
jgi:hypothetical protein